jgi:hypothetical protein
MMYQTDDRGVYRIYGLPAGHYKLSAGDEGRGSGVMRAAGYYPRTYYPDSSEIGKAAIIDVSEGGETKNIDIKLGRRALTYTVSGRIVDAEGGQPLLESSSPTAPSSRIKTKATSAALPAQQVRPILRVSFAWKV